MFLRCPPCLVWRSLFGNRQLKGWKSSSWDILFRAAPEIYWRSQCASDKSLSSNFCLYIIQVAITAHIFQQCLLHSNWSYTWKVTQVVVWKVKKESFRQKFKPRILSHLTNHCLRGVWKSVSDVVRWFDKHLFWSILWPWVEPLLTSSTVKPHYCKTKSKVWLTRFVLFALPSILTTCRSRANIWTTAQISMRFATDSYCSQWMNPND